MSNMIQLDTMITKATPLDGGVIRIEGYANTIDKDRASDVILATAWQTRNALTNYKKNPIILFGHDHRRPVGKSVELIPDSNGLFIAAEVIQAADPQVYSMVQHEILKTFSVGFSCLDADWEDHSDTFVIKDLELHEISIVAVPCNQDSTFAVAKSLDSSSYSKFKSQFIKHAEPQEDPEFTRKLKQVYDLVFKGTL